MVVPGLKQPWAGVSQRLRRLLILVFNDAAVALTWCSFHPVVLLFQRVVRRFQRTVSVDGVDVSARWASGNGAADSVTGSWYSLAVIEEADVIGSLLKARLAAVAFGVVTVVTVAVLFVVKGHALGEGVAMDTEDYRSFREVLLVFGERFFDVELLKL